jgi:hypothetical protein
MHFKFQDARRMERSPLTGSPAGVTKGRWCQFSHEGLGVRRFDVAAMFGSLWLLASMVIDIATPKELTVYMIGAAIAPATAISALLYWLGVPRTDFAVCFAVLWMVSGMLIELISPKPLSPFMIVVAVAPMAIVGAVINLQCWRRSPGT